MGKKSGFCRYGLYARQYEILAVKLHLDGSIFSIDWES